MPVIDAESMGNLRDIHEFGGNEAVWDLIETLETEFKSLVEQAQAAMQAGDLKGVALAGHTIKGSAGNFGAKRLSKLAEFIEKSAKAGISAGLPESVARLSSECEKAVQAFREEFPL